ncbi:TrbI/VirB10 family protein [Orientia tsutsugamushi]|uniref:Conjugative pilus assembly protein n=1 Tax=Orientia tsutsugamushi (strain Boryong) TaxID=357244 RepID=A5CDW0_ORITB|nr:TrbI/VirB10 family protein [Orientia tsutsugamushi]CAM80133.1 conjugative pilus assembly protein [Orientia tsutsugamushi str. Boryong]
MVDLASPSITGLSPVRLIHLILTHLAYYVPISYVSAIFSSIAKFLQTKAIKPDMTPTLNLVAGGQQQQEFQIGDALQSGAYSGASNAFDKLADFAIKRADSMSPVIVVASGRVIDVVFKKGFDLCEHKKKLKIQLMRHQLAMKKLICIINSTNHKG